MARTTTRQRDSVKVDRLFVSPNVFGSTWYVDGTNGNDSSDGLDPNSALATLGAARTASSAGDIIVVAPGTYTQTAAAEPLTPKANQQWIAAVANYGAKPTVIVEGTAETDVVDIEVDGVIFSGFCFQADHNDVARLVKVADTVAVTGLTFLDCWFDGNSKTTVNGISAIDATYALEALYAYRCRFTQCDIGISIGVQGFADSMVEECIFDMQDAGGGDIGIQLADTSALATGYGFLIRRNDFLGAIDAGADSVGIVIGGTEDTTAIGVIRNNFFAYCGASAITVDKISKSQINNYYGDAGTGGTLVDPGT